MSKIFVIGSGGRENAIIYSLLKSNKVSQVFSATSNAKICQITTPSNIDSNNHQEILNFCQDNSIDLVIIGPEQPLVDGLTDFLQDNNIKVFGPSKKASQLEGSKIFMKDLCAKYNVPTAKYQSFDNSNLAIKFLDQINLPIVIKTDGLAAGKGVIIAQTKKDAANSIEEIFTGKFGKAGNKIIIEEFLEGVEVSFFAICDGKNAKFIGTAGDHKKIGEGETGLNTGGMGTYSPSPFIDHNLQEDIMQNIIQPTLDAMNREDCSFAGILFAGIILTKNGPKLLEFNIRFGDPEAEAILPRLKTDLFDIINATISSKLGDISVEFSDQKSVCVILASNGYPESYKKGSEINNIEDKLLDDEIIFHAGTKLENGKILSNGGRVLACVALADDFKSAIDKSYQIVSKVKWPDCYYRRDIGKKLLEE
ncbi:phosphoribosylamine--glycine ligase [Rickettsiales bacterium]|nr:phosphoribosylamine--glycine ligase [Rickettsiales bacterium]MDB2550884.1 phosphoribosylamine--glycine ligase [Rickettsiales bacterium]